MSRDNGGPAFPVPGLQEHEEFNGMSLRDYFAAKAMQGLLACGEEHCDATGYATASAAYKIADEMLAERSK